MIITNIGDQPATGIYTNDQLMSDERWTWENNKGRYYEHDRFGGPSIGTSNKFDKLPLAKELEKELEDLKTKEEWKAEAEDLKRKLEELKMTIDFYLSALQKKLK